MAQRARLGHWALMSLVVGVASSHGDDAPKSTTIKKSLQISAKAIEAPAMKHRLLPLASERKPGNAAPMYMRLGMDRADDRKSLELKCADWNDRTLEKLPLDEMRTMLTGYSYALRQLHLGARRRSCDWNYALDDHRIFWILLPDAQIMRQQARMLVANTRLQIAEGKLDDAAESIETGFAFSQHVANGPFLINGLVGIACGTSVSECLFDFVSQPNARNLYWSLTALPRPLVDLRDAFETEQRIPELEIPDLADIRRPRQAGEWDALWLRIHSWLNDIADASNTGAKLKKTDFAGRMSEFVANETPQAKRYLKEAVKLSDAKINAMTPTQLIVLHFHHRYSELRDNGFKALYLAPSEAAPFLMEAEKHLKDAPSDLATDLARHILPAVRKGQLATVRLDRRIALLRIVEALRLHAAHTGSLPDRLADVVAVPIPLDPLTGKAFETHRDGAGLVIETPRTEAETTNFEVRVELRK